MSPASGYELSLYGATPPSFWAAIGVAFASALTVSVVIRPRGLHHVAALGLALASSVTVASLPILRGYYFYGSGDSLTHYGWAKDIAAGTLSPLNFLYPGVHVSALLLRDALGVSTRLGLELTVVVLLVVFLVFVPLCVRAITDVDGALAVGAFTAVLLLPINDISVFLMVHPSSQTVLFTPFVLYAAFRYLRTPAHGRRWVSASGAVLALASTAALLFHPQQALNVVVVFVTIALVQAVTGRTGWFGALAAHRRFYGQALYLTAAFLVWTPLHQRATSTSTAAIESLLHGSSGADTVATHASSLSALGMSLPGLFVRIFLPSAVFCVLAALTSLAVLRARHRDAPADGSELATYLACSLGPLTLAFLAVMVALSGEQRFRYVGFLMVPILVLGAVRLTCGTRWVARRTSKLGGRTALAVCFAVLIPLCLATYFLSPFIYQPNSQVTAQEATGYEWAFSHESASAPLLGIHGGGGRLADATYGTTEIESSPPARDIPGLNAVVPPDVLTTNLTTNYPTDRSLVVTRRNKRVEEGLYRGLRYPRGSLDALDRTRGVDRVQANGGFTLYYVNNSTAP